MLKFRVLAQDRISRTPPSAAAAPASSAAHSASYVCLFAVVQGRGRMGACFVRGKSHLSSAETAERWNGLICQTSCCQFAPFAPSHFPLLSTLAVAVAGWLASPNQRFFVPPAAHPVSA